MIFCLCCFWNIWAPNCFNVPTFLIIDTKERVIPYCMKITESNCGGCNSSKERYRITAWIITCALLVLLLYRTRTKFIKGWCYINMKLGPTKLKWRKTFPGIVLWTEVGRQSKRNMMANSSIFLNLLLFQTCESFKKKFDSTHIRKTRRRYCCLM